MTTPPNQVNVFLSYAHEDEAWVKKLETHLSTLKRQGVISTWYDREIVPGTNRADVIDQRLEQASIVLLFVSADFLASDACYDIEMTRALQRHKAGAAKVIPLIIRPTDWTTAPFAHLSPLPTDAKAITTWNNKDEAFVAVVSGLRRAIEDLSFLPASPSHAALPSIWNIPYPHNPFFMGRDEVLEKLHTQFQTGQITALSQSPYAISGLGGIGKTQIATEYAYRYHQDYEAVLWARADKHEDLVSSFLAIATRLRLPERDEKDQEIIIVAVKRWLQDHQRWLLILDNADDLDLLPAFLPPTAGGHIMITTRTWDLQRLAVRFEVEPLSEEQGAHLLVQRAALVTTLRDWDHLAPEDRRVALSLTRQLGGLPLALDQAGAYIEACGCSLRDYEELYQIHRLAVLQERRSRVLDHPEGVTTTWSLSFKRVQEKNTAAADLLRLCAFCAPDAIAEEILTTKPEVLGPLLAPLGANALQLNQAIEALRTYSLIRRDPKERTLSVHRLVQAVLQDSMEETEQLLWTKRAMLAINAAFPHPVHETWGQCERLLTQALAGVRIIQMYQITSKEAARLLYECASYLQDRTRYTEAESLYQYALHIREQVLGPEHLEAASPLHGLAELYREQSKHAEAEPLYWRALHIWEQALGSEHPQVVPSLYGLAVLYREQSKYAEAEPLYWRALHIWEQALGSEHLEISYPLNGLAVLYAEQGKYAEAEPLYRRALYIREQALGPKHVEVAHPLNNLANLYVTQGKYTEAELLHQRALHIREQALGPEHPQVAFSLNNLANLYNIQGKYAEAEPLCQRALYICEQALGSENPQVAHPLDNLANSYVMQGKYAEAKPLYQRALHICEQALGPEHPQVAFSLNNLGTLYRKQGKYTEAEPLYQRALYIWERALGPEHVHTKQVRDNYDHLLRAMKRNAEIRKLEELE